jgi:hypothetical protein
MLCGGGSSCAVSFFTAVVDGGRVSGQRRGRRLEKGLLRGWVDGDLP